jgi:hypothetical protein
MNSSSTKDYCLLRLLYNFPIGACLAYLIYLLAWSKVNFACDTSLIGQVWCEVVEWILITCAAMAYALNPVRTFQLKLGKLIELSSSSVPH